MPSDPSGRSSYVRCASPITAAVLYVFLAWHAAVQLRRVAGMMLVCLKQAAQRIPSEPANDHRARIAADEAFYAGWLKPRIDNFYEWHGWNHHSEGAGEALEAPNTNARRRLRNQLTLAWKVKRKASHWLATFAQRRQVRLYWPQRRPRLFLQRRLRGRRRARTIKSREQTAEEEPQVNMHADSWVASNRTNGHTSLRTYRMYVMSCSVELYSAEQITDRSHTFRLTHRRSIMRMQQVDALGVDPRLVHKWQARKQMRSSGRRNQHQRPYLLWLSLTLVFTVACLRRMCSTVGRTAFQLRLWLVSAILVSGTLRTIS